MNDPEVMERIAAALERIAWLIGVQVGEEQAIKLILKANGITGPLVPLAIKVLREQFESGEAFGSDVLGPFTAAFNPAGSAAATLGKEKKRRSKKQKAQDKKKSAAWETS